MKAKKAKPAKAKAKAKPKPKSRVRARVRVRKGPTRTRTRARTRTRSSLPPGSRWIRLVAKHGIVLASARGVVPSLAEAVAGEPIVGSWWAHPKAHAIFDALSELDDSADVRCFKLVDGKITLVHRRVWPALVCLARAGVLPADAVASVQQEHLPTGEHRNLVTPFPDWVDDATAAAATALAPAAARAQLPWLAS